MTAIVVRVYLSIEQKKLLERMCKTLGIDESEALREAFMDYAKSISLITEKVHGKI
ncbi:MAG: ribbon-helix-helix protein, CopG family [Candidatus Bathyarchaeia archaeon]